MTATRADYHAAAEKCRYASVTVQEAVSAVDLLGISLPRKLADMATDLFTLAAEVERVGEERT